MKIKNTKQYLRASDLTSDLKSGNVVRKVSFGSFSGYTYKMG